MQTVYNLTSQCWDCSLKGKLQMKKFQLLLPAVVFAIIFAKAEANTFWFPLDGYYPYSSDNNITAVPDLDNRSNYMKSRMNETGNYWNGYLYAGPVVGFKKDGTGNWELDGVPYIGNKTYLFYDNHRGYDFAVPKDTKVHTVEAGKFCGITAIEGQVCIEHDLSYGKFRTYYTHMDIANWVYSLSYGTTIGKWAHIGNVSNVSAMSVGYHLHFVTYKYEPGHPDYNTRVGTIGYGWIVVDPYGLKDGVDGYDIEPYLWN